MKKILCLIGLFVLGLSVFGSNEYLEKGPFGINFGMPLTDCDVIEILHESNNLIYAQVRVPSSDARFDTYYATFYDVYGLVEIKAKKWIQEWNEHDGINAFISAYNRGARKTWQEEIIEEAFVLTDQLYDDLCNIFGEEYLLDTSMSEKCTWQKKGIEIRLEGGIAKEFVLADLVEMDHFYGVLLIYSGSHQKEALRKYNKIQEEIRIKESQQRSYSLAF